MASWFYPPRTGASDKVIGRLPGMTEDTDHGDLEIGLSIEDPAWHGLVPGLTDLVEAVSRATLGCAALKAGAGGSSELSIVLGDDALLRRLNSRYRGRDRATNVLSFAYRDPDRPAPCLGDIAVARETVQREAADQAKSVADHLSHLLVHGLLHLCGFDHQSEVDTRKMERLEIDILSELGVSNPYRERNSIGRARPVPVLF